MGCHRPASNEKRVLAPKVEDDGTMGCAGGCWPFALAASSHFCRVLGSTGHFSAASAVPSGGMLGVQAMRWSRVMESRSDAVVLDEYESGLDYEIIDVL